MWGRKKRIGFTLAVLGVFFLILQYGFGLDVARGLGLLGASILAYIGILGIGLGLLVVAGWILENDVK